MTELNLARFKINGTPAEDANGKRGYDATASETLACTLERNPASGVLSVTYQVFDPAEPTSPLASLGATLQYWDANSQHSITSDSANDSFDLTVDAATILDSFVIRCTAVTAAGSHIWERLVSVRQSGLRMTIPSETQQYDQRGWSDAMNELTEFVAGGGLGLTPPADPGDDGKVAVAQGGDLTYVFIDNSHIAAGADIDITKLDYGSASPGDVLVISGGGTPTWGSVSGGMTPPTASGDDGKVAFASTTSPGDLDYADAVKIVNPGGAQDGFAFGAAPAGSGVLRFSALFAFAAKFGGTPTDVEFIQATSSSLKIGGTSGSVLTQVDVWVSSSQVFIFTPTYHRIFVDTLSWGGSVGSPTISQQSQGASHGKTFTISAQDVTGVSLNAASLVLQSGRTTPASPGNPGFVFIKASYAGSTGRDIAATFGSDATDDGWVGLGTNFANAGILRLPDGKYITSDYSGVGALALKLIGHDPVYSRTMVGDSGGPTQLDLVSTSGFIRILQATTDPATLTFLYAGPTAVESYNRDGDFAVGFGNANSVGVGHDLILKAQWSLQSGNWNGGRVAVKTGKGYGSGAPGDFQVWFGDETHERLNMNGDATSDGGMYLYRPPTGSEYCRLSYRELIMGNRTEPDSQVAIVCYGMDAGYNACCLTIRAPAPGTGAANPKGGNVRICGASGNTGGPGGNVVLRTFGTWGSSSDRGVQFVLEAAGNAGPSGSRAYTARKVQHYTSVATTEVVAWDLDKLDLLPDDSELAKPSVSLVVYLRWTILAYTGDGATSTGVYWRQAVLKIQDVGTFQVWMHPTEIVAPASYGCPLQGTAPWIGTSGANIQFHITPSVAGADFQFQLDVQAFYAP